VGRYANGQLLDARGVAQGHRRPGSEFIGAMIEGEAERVDGESRRRFIQELTNGGTSGNAYLYPKSQQL